MHYEGRQLLVLVPLAVVLKLCVPVCRWSWGHADLSQRPGDQHLPPRIRPGAQQQLWPRRLQQAVGADCSAAQVHGRRRGFHAACGPRCAEPGPGHRQDQPRHDGVAAGERHPGLAATALPFGQHLHDAAHFRQADGPGSLLHQAEQHRQGGSGLLLRVHLDDGDGPRPGQGQLPRQRPLLALRGPHRDAEDPILRHLALAWGSEERGWAAKGAVCVLPRAFEGQSVQGQ
mmetsp:Transcript_119788/g.284605  ORF Transcript_119788/g.284605 Transcript_119788/m.284605 type:complete len:230 (-) Transcript_119788:666-1355(-)